MKKNFLKKLAFTMAFATAFTALSPAAGVFAAKAPSLTVGKTLTLLLGTDRESHDINVNNKVKGSTYKWTTSNKAVATVNAKNGIVEGVKTGTAKVTLKITLPTKKTKTLTTTVNVKDNIKELAVKVKEAEIKDNKLQKTLVAGEVVDFDRTIVSTFGGNTKAHKGAITRWEVLDADKKETTKASADDTGLFVATEPGTYLVSAVSFQSKAKYNEWLKSGDANLVTARAEAVEVTVAASITGVTQTTPNEIELYFDADMSKVVTKDNLVIEVNDASKQKQIVEKVTFADSDKGLKATVKTYLEFKDGVVYNVTVDKTALKAEFKASKGEATYLKITGPSTVVFGKETEISYGIYDANNVRLSNTGATLSITEGSANGYLVTVDGKTSINIFEKDKTVVVEASYSTGKVDAEKYELIYLKDTIAITSREALPTVVGNYKATIKTGDAPNWDDFTPNNNIGLQDTGYKLYVQMILDQDGAEVKETTGFTYESMDASKLLVGTDGTLVPFAEGTVYVKVTKAGTTLSVLVPVHIGGQRKAVSWVFDANTKTVSNAELADDSVVFKATAKDNYGAETTVSGIVVTPMGNAPAVQRTTGNTNEVKFVGTDFTTHGTFQYKVEFAGLVSMLTVVVRDGSDGTVTGYKLDGGNTKLDTARNDDNQGAQEVTLQLLGYNAAGTLVRKYAASEYTITPLSGPEGYASTVSGNQFNLTTTSAATKTVSGVAYEVVEKAANGTYLFKATLHSNNKEVARTAIVVENNQTKASLVQTDINVTLATGTVLDAVRDSFDAYVGATKLDDVRIIEVEGKTSTNAPLDHNSTVTNGTFVVTKVTVAQIFGEFVVVDEVVVNRAVTVSGVTNN